MKEDIKKENQEAEKKNPALDPSLSSVEIPDLSQFEFPSDYEAFEDENLNMLP